MLGSLLSPAKGIRSCTVFTLDLQKEKCPHEMSQRRRRLRSCQTTGQGRLLRVSLRSDVPHFTQPIRWVPHSNSGERKSYPGTSWEVGTYRTCLVKLPKTKLREKQRPSSSPLFFGFFVGFCVLPKKQAQLLDIFGFSHATKPL